MLAVISPELVTAVHLELADYVASGCFRVVFLDDGEWTVTRVDGCPTASIRKMVVQVLLHAAQRCWTTCQYASADGRVAVTASGCIDDLNVFTGVFQVQQNSSRAIVYDLLVRGDVSVPDGWVFSTADLQVLYGRCARDGSVLRGLGLMPGNCGDPMCAVDNLVRSQLFRLSKESTLAESLGVTFLKDMCDHPVFHRPDWWNEYVDWLPSVAVQGLETCKLSDHGSQWQVVPCVQSGNLLACADTLCVQQPGGQVGVTVVKQDHYVFIPENSLLQAAAHAERTLFSMKIQAKGEFTTLSSEAVHLLCKVLERELSSTSCSLKTVCKKRMVTALFSVENMARLCEAKTFEEWCVGQVPSCKDLLPKTYRDSTWCLDARVRVEAAKRGMCRMSFH